jgi:uncharacterized protein (TIGR03067 family)
VFGPGSCFEEFAMGRMILLVLVTGLWQGAEAEKETKLELDKLQGTWILESVETKGAELPKEKIAKNVIAIRGDKLTTSSRERVLAEVTFKIDPTKSPKWIDQTSKNKEGKRVVRPGIYELTGDTLRLAFDRERPKELKTTPESSLNITVYKRKKE